MIKNLFKIDFPDLDKNSNKVLLITGVRILFFSVILITTVLYELKQKTFFNTESILPLYFLLITAFVLNSIYLLFFKRVQSIWQSTAFLFVFDAIFISGLIYITGIQQSIFLFLYLINIILCGFLFQRKGAFLLALFTSCCFSLLLIASTEVQGQTLYFAVGLNNLAFFAIAYLSGYLSEVVNFMGSEIKTQRQDIKTLQDINKIIVENISSGLITISQTFQIMLFNPAAEKILGMNQNLHGKDLNEVFPGMREFIENRTEYNRFERRFENSKGEKLILGFSVSPLKATEGDEGGFILIFQDLTEVLRFEAAMRRQDKLAAIGKLAAGIAHEIRNPLASISGSVELLKSLIIIKNPEEQKLMNIMLKEISRLNSLITEFLDFVKPEEKKIEVCDVNSIIRETLEMIKVNNTLPQNVKQITHLDARGLIPGDKNKLKQVFLNLFINSYQAMNEIENRQLEIISKNQGEYLIIKIKDSGHGMSEGTQRRLFEPFFTTKQKGTGLGLATVHKILETHDAKIFVESHEGAGTEFTIQFNQVIIEGAQHNEGQNTGS